MLWDTPLPVSACAFLSISRTTPGLQHAFTAATFADCKAPALERAEERRRNRATLGKP